MALTENQKKFIELERKKAEVKKYFEDLKVATQAVANEIGVGGHFQDEAGIVYQIVIPDGRFVGFDHIGYLRTRRPDEKRGDLSMKKAEELGYILNKEK